jgi:hypothetical protein
VEENKTNGREEIFSEKVKAGKRTYFFDVKATRSNDYYLTITESKKRFKDDGFTYEKHKIFLYKEDFNKFLDALTNTVNHVKHELMPNIDFTQFDHPPEREEAAAEASPLNGRAAETNGRAAETGGGGGIDSDLKWD